MRSLRPTRRTVVRLVLRSVAVAGAVTLTVSLAGQPSRSAFTASTGDAGNRVTAAADFCSSPGGQTLNPTADVAAYQSQPTTNYGNHVNLGALSGPTANTRSFLRFGPLPGVPSGCVLTATLRLRANSATAGRTIDVYRIDPTATAWTEGGVTWNAMPPPSTDTAVWSASLAGAGWQEWTVTSLMPGLYAVNSGFMVRDRTDSSNPAGSQLYDSRNSATSGNWPQLVLAWN
jgi:acid phosphatase type 7